MILSLSLALVQIIVEDDLVDTCKPGDRVNMIGIYKAIPPRANGTLQGTFRAVVVANAVKLLLRDASAANITADDIRWAEAISGLVGCHTWSACCHRFRGKAQPE